MDHLDAPIFSFPFQLMLQAKELAEKTCGGRSKDASCRSDSKTRPWIAGGYWWMLVVRAGIHGEPQQCEGLDPILKPDNHNP